MKTDNWQIIESYFGVNKPNMFRVFKNGKEVNNFMLRQYAEQYVEMCKYKYHVIIRHDTNNQDTVLNTTYDLYHDLEFDCSFGNWFDLEQEMNALDVDWMSYDEDESPFAVYHDVNGLKRIRCKSHWTGATFGCSDDHARDDNVDAAQYAQYVADVEFEPAGPGYSLDEDLDMVNNPPHYNNHPSGIQCIEVVRHMNFNLGNAVKYCWRTGRKDNLKAVEDLRKAIWYIEDEISRLESTY